MAAIIAPLRIYLGMTRAKKEKWFSLNLNEYRNANFHTLNKSKILFKEEMKQQISSLPLLHNIAIQYKLFPKTRRELDVSNVCSIVDKYFSDALVELGKLPDDNYKYLSRVEYVFGHVDSNFPRVEVKIYDYDTKTLFPKDGN